MTRLSYLVLICYILYPTSLGQETCTTRNKLRLNPVLVNSSEWSESGRLEICDCDSMACTWNTISTGSENGSWSWPNVQVACRQLKNDTGVAFTGLGNPVYLSMTANDSYVFTSIFTCDGTETSLTDCVQSSLPSGDVYEVYITCSKIVYTGHIKLSGSTVPHQGAVEVYVRSSGQWETVCVDNFGSNEADVTCRTLGYASGVLTVLANNFKGNQINKATGISGIVCTGSERDIDSCFFTRSAACSRTNVLAGVTCTPSSSGSGSARLFTLSTFNDYQRVEVLFGGRWGSVCENSWDHTDGQVTCQSLNRPIEDTEIPTEFIPIIASQRPIWVYGYHCNGTETNLTLCSLVNDYPIGYAPGCNHTHDAGLYCGTVSTSGGLSAGAIAGIVIGTLCGACCLVIIGLVIAFCIYLYCCEDGCECECNREYHREYDCGDCDCDCFGCFKSSRRRRNRVTEGVHEVQLSSYTTSTTTTTRRESLTIALTEEERIVQEFEREQEQKKKTEEEKKLEDAELSKPAPPSYNDALTLEGVTTLPEYIQKEEEPSSDPLPYPIISTDPAFPPSHSSEV